MKHVNDESRPFVRIGVAGKYVGMQDTYLSVVRALEHASWKVGVRVFIEWIDCDVTSLDELNARIRELHGVLIPGGFGVRAIEGMITVAAIARNNNIPIFGICLGMQIQLIELARNVIGWRDANSAEFDPTTEHPVVTLSKQQHETSGILGGTMRLGMYEGKFGSPDLKVREYFQQNQSTFKERHRHRYEADLDTVEQLTSAEKIQFDVVGSDMTGQFVEMIQYRNSDEAPYNYGCQFHPEFKSRHTTPHPLFVAFLDQASMLAKT